MKQMDDHEYLLVFSFREKMKQNTAKKRTGNLVVRQGVGLGLGHEPLQPKQEQVVRIGVLVQLANLHTGANSARDTGDLDCIGTLLQCLDGAVELGLEFFSRALDMVLGVLHVVAGYGRMEEDEESKKHGQDCPLLAVSGHVEGMGLSGRAGPESKE